MKTKIIGFIGGGNMATSLISGLISSGHPSAKIWVADIDSDKLQLLRESMAINTTQDNTEIISVADVVVLAVKPQMLKTIAKTIAERVSQKQPLLVSIAAGINQDSLSHWLGEDCAIVRCMPNTPALVQSGATGLHANNNVSTAQRDLAENILRAVGITLWVDDENLMDTVTAVSGSGPAYFLLLMEAMEQSAMDLGLDMHAAQLLVQQTALGAAKIALESSESAQQLRHRVTSPGGTTEQAIAIFQAGNFQQLVGSAIKAAYDRSIEMSLQLGEH